MQAASVVSAAEKIATRGVAQKKGTLRDAAKGTETIMGAIRCAGERGNRISFDPMIHHTSLHCSNVHGSNKIRDQTRDINSGRWGFLIKPASIREALCKKGLSGSLSLPALSVARHDDLRAHECPLSHKASRVRSLLLNLPHD